MLCQDQHYSAQEPTKEFVDTCWKSFFGCALRWLESWVQGAGTDSQPNLCLIWNSLSHVTLPLLHLPGSYRELISIPQMEQMRHQIQHMAHLVAARCLPAEQLLLNSPKAMTQLKGSTGRRNFLCKSGSVTQTCSGSAWSTMPFLHHPAVPSA